MVGLSLSSCWASLMGLLRLKLNYEGEILVVVTSGISLYWVLFIASSFVNRVRGLSFLLATW